MRFASYEVDGIITYGSVLHVPGGAMLTDIGSDHGNDLRHWIEVGAIDELKKIATGLRPKYAEIEVTYLPPILSGEKIVCLGANYANPSLMENGDSGDLPNYPSVYLKHLEQFTGHGQNIVGPAEYGKLSHKGEIVIIIGKEGRKIPRNEAYSYIAGLTLMNESIILDGDEGLEQGILKSKGLENAGVIGPWMMTADEVTDYTNLKIQTKVNGELRQDDITSDLLFPIDYIVAYLSTFMTLKPGDMISTGTTKRVSEGVTPHKLLKHGDVVVVEGAGIGKLRNGVEDDPLHKRA